MIRAPGARARPLALLAVAALGWVPAPLPEPVGRIAPAAAQVGGTVGGQGLERQGAVHPRGTWGWPLRPAPTVVRRFEPPPEPWASGHRGVDLLGTPGQPVLAAGDGVVSFSGVVAGRGVVTVRHAGGWRTTYEPVDDRVRRGTSVRRSERVGVLASDGSHCAPRACLHWGALAGPRDYRDPLALLGLVPPVLLPW